VATLSRANVLLGEAFADVAAAVCEFARPRIDLIASHGQTILHAPEGAPPHTLQIGEPSLIAERTGVTTVADFRPRDMAAGGQGAPLVPFFDHFVFSGQAPVAMVNIGGISNVTWVERSLRRVRATDIGPGNCMIDEATRAATKGRMAYDSGGDLARQGRLDGALLKRFQAHPFLARKAPKSACRSDFVPDFLHKTCRRWLKRDPLRVVSTTTFFAAETIARSVRGAARVIVSGGGVFNTTLMEHLKDLLHPAPVHSIAEFGWPPLAKEPAAFALLGYRALLGLGNTLPGATGAARSVPAGKILPGANFESLLRRTRS
jgi:anhydro-N-acetylmuramic acid kinase